MSDTRVTVTLPDDLAVLASLGRRLEPLWSAQFLNREELVSRTFSLAMSQVPKPVSDWVVDGRLVVAIELDDWTDDVPAQHVLQVGFTQTGGLVLICTLAPRFPAGVDEQAYEDLYQRDTPHCTLQAWGSGGGTLIWSAEQLAALEAFNATVAVLPRVVPA